MLLPLTIFLAAVSQGLAATCVCVTASIGLNARTGPGTSNPVVTAMTNGECYPYRSASNGWYKFDYKGRELWSSGSYMVMKTCPGSETKTNTGGSVTTGCPRIISRSGWGARSASGPRLSQKPRYVFIHHGTGPACSTQVACTRIVKAYQNYHMDTKKWGDIAYSFVVGEDGNVYEARGWNRIGAHTKGYNDNGIAICFIGDFTSRVPNQKALTAAKQLISCGRANGQIPSNYILKGHRDVGSTSCPGTALYNLVRTWTHYG